MYEMSIKMRGNMKRILHAMDVILPFDNHSVSHEHRIHSASRLPSPSVSQVERSAARVTSQVVASADVSFACGSEDIPTLDLGEKILAEQRRVSARKRKGPGAPAPEPEPESSECPEEPLLETAGPVQTASDDVVRLQQIVAEIVARDIERLCQGLKRMPCCSQG